jgi:hypothetical protein
MAEVAMEVGVAEEAEVDSCVVQSNNKDENGQLLKTG